MPSTLLRLLTVCACIAPAVSQAGPSRPPRAPAVDLMSAMTIVDFTRNAQRPHSATLTPLRRFVTRVSDDPTAWILVRFQSTPMKFDFELPLDSSSTLFLIPELDTSLTSNSKPWRPRVPTACALLGMPYSTRIPSADPKFALPGSPPPNAQIGDVCVIDCFPSGTEVHTPTGPRQIDDVHAGDSVLDAHGAPAAVRAVRHSLASELLAVTTRSGTFRTTANHRMLTMNRGWVRAEHLTDTDHLANGTPCGDAVLQTTREQRVAHVCTLELDCDHVGFRVGPAGVIADAAQAPAASR